MIPVTITMMIFEWRTKMISLYFKIFIIMTNNSLKKINLFSSQDKLLADTFLKYVQTCFTRSRFERDKTIG